MFHLNLWAHSAQLPLNKTEWNSTMLRHTIIFLFKWVPSCYTHLPHWLPCTNEHPFNFCCFKLMSRESSHCDLINTRWQRLASMVLNECRALQHCCHVFLAVPCKIMIEEKWHVWIIHVLHAFEHVLKYWFHKQWER